MGQSEYQQKRLKIMQRRALLLLISMACVYIGAICFQKVVPWLAFFAAFSGAALVGGIADWFAIVALFRHPAGIPVWHTSIIPRSKDSIADNLANFVREKFLGVESIAELIEKHDPAQKLSDWLVQPRNTERLGKHLLQLSANILDFIEDEPVQKLIAQAIQNALDKIDLSKSAGMILEQVTKDEQHQLLLTEGIKKFSAFLSDKETQEYFAEEIVKWLKKDYKYISTIIPKEWISNKVAVAVIDRISEILEEIIENENHELRIDFTENTKKFIEKLKSDPEFIAQGEKIKNYLKMILTAYLKGLWSPLRDWLKHDIESSDSRIHKQISGAGQWMGRKLADDPELRNSINKHIAESAKNMAPDFSDFLTKHISDTVKGWDSRHMSRQIELSIGSDLQYIRINGTIVGGLVGLGIYCVSYFSGFAIVQ